MPSGEGSQPGGEFAVESVGARRRLQPVPWTGARRANRSNHPGAALPGRAQGVRRRGAGARRGRPRGPRRRLRRAARPQRRGQDHAHPQRRGAVIPDGGQIAVLGRSMRGPEATGRRAQLDRLRARRRSPSTASCRVRELLIAARALLRHAPRRRPTTRADELLEAFDLTDKAASYANRLSGGMRRRLLLARALLHRPRAGDPGRAHRRGRPGAAPRPVGVHPHAPRRRHRDPPHHPLPRGGRGALRASSRSSAPGGSSPRARRTSCATASSPRASRTSTARWCAHDRRRPAAARSGAARRRSPSARSLRVLRLWSQTIAPNVRVRRALHRGLRHRARRPHPQDRRGRPTSTFIVPGLVLMGVGTSGLRQHRHLDLPGAQFDGFIEDPASSPMSARHLLCGYLAGGVVREPADRRAHLRRARLFWSTCPRSTPRRRSRCSCARPRLLGARRGVGLYLDRLGPADRVGQPRHPAAGLPGRRVLLGRRCSASPGAR